VKTKTKRDRYFSVKVLLEVFRACRLYGDEA